MRQYWGTTPCPDTLSFVCTGAKTMSSGFEKTQGRNRTRKRSVCWNDTLKLLRATCKYLLPAGSINPFSGVPTRETETIFRKSFTPEELKAIVDAARDDDFTRPILITGICTAMRRGDCCLLKWAVDVVLKHYYQPGREEFRRALQSAMPKLLTNGTQTLKEQIVERLNQAKAKTWKEDVARLRDLVGQL